MLAVLCSNGKMSNFMLDVVKNKLLLMLVVNCCDRRNIIMALLPSCNTEEADTLHRAKSKQVYIFVPFPVAQKQTLLVAFVQILDPFSL